MNNAKDGDIIKLDNDISLTAGDWGKGDCFSIPQNCLVTLELNGKNIDIGAGSASNNFGVGENSALLIKNGSIKNIDTNDDDTGVLILSGVTVTENICTDSTQIWIVNNSSVENLLVVESGGTIDGNVLMNDLNGEVILLGLDVIGKISNSYHSTIINSGHYNNIDGGSGKITINNGYYSGNLVGQKYEIINGYFIYKPDPSYITASKAAVKCNVEEKEKTYYYTIGDHVHSWKYFAKDNYLYAYCSEDNNCMYYGNEAELNDSIKLALSKPSNCVYNGSPIEAEINENESDINSWEYFFNELPVIKYEAKTGSSLLNDKAVNVGSYTASISAGVGPDEKQQRWIL